MTENGNEEIVDQGIDHSQDRYPDVNDVLALLPEQAHFPNGQIYRLEVGCLANGESTWRVWPTDSEESVGGIIPSPEDS